MLIKRVTTMAKVIEPIAHLSLRILRHNMKFNSSKIFPLFTSTNFQSLSPLPSTHNMTNSIRCMSSTVTNANDIIKIDPPRQKKSSKKIQINPVLKKKLDPEKMKKAQAAQKLHRINKEMFGELLETSAQKSKRVKKENKKAKKLVTKCKVQIPLRDDNYYLNPVLDPTEEEEPISSVVDTIDAPNFLPLSTKIKTARSGGINGNEALDLDPSSHENKPLEHRKGAEINWMLKATRGMTRVIKGNFYNDPSTLSALSSTTTKNPSLQFSTMYDVGFKGGRKKSFNKKSSPLLTTNNKTQQSKEEDEDEYSRGASSSPPSITSQSRAAATNLTQNAHEQFLKSLFNSGDIYPRSEVIILKREGGNNNSYENYSFLEEELIGPSSHTIQHNQLQHPVHHCTKEDFTNNTIQPTNDPTETKSFSQVSSQESKNHHHGISTNSDTENQMGKGADMGSKDCGPDKVPNKYNQKTPSIIISVPYFNPERDGAAVTKRNQDPNLDQSHSNSCTETNDFQTNSGTRNQQIISIPFPRSSTYTVNVNAVNNVNPNPRLPSVSKILSSTMPKEQAAALERWQAKMISEMGEEGFRTYKENMLNNGRMLHSNIENVLRGTPMNEILVADSISGHWNSLNKILPEVKNVLVLESRVQHPALKYSGIVDCVAVFRNKLVVIDWKTSQKPKPFISMTYDTPLQIAAYIGAINYDPNYSLKITEGLIVIAYEDGKTGHTFMLKPEDVANYWDKWTKRLNAFNALKETESNVV